MKPLPLGYLLAILIAWHATPLAAQPPATAEAEPTEPTAPPTTAPSPFNLEGFLTPTTEPPPAEQPPTGSHWALIICGHPGDEDHRTQFAETIETLHDALINNCGFDSEKIIVQFGGEVLADDGLALTSAKGEATAAELRAQVKELATEVGEHDTLWTIVMGHAHHNGRHTFLNIPGTDVHQDDFASWFTDIRGQQVFFITTPVSGYFIRPLTGQRRVVITSTQADLEVNETLYPQALAEVLAEPPPMSQFDVDSDQKLTLFDLYITVTRNVAKRYLAETLLATEHALLDDNADGIGTELQLDYLTDEQGGRARDEVSPPKIRPNSDGAQAIAFDLSMIELPAEEPEEPSEDEPSEDEPADDQPLPGE